MKVLLVSPASRSFNHYRPPLALMLLSGYLKKNGVETQVVDVVLRHQVRDSAFFRQAGQYLKDIEAEILRTIGAADTDIIGITCYTPEIDEVEKLARQIRTLKPQAKLVVGGVHPTFYPRDFLGPDSPFDVAVVGEGELTLLDLVRALRGNKPLRDVPGIAFRDPATRSPVVTPARPVAENLDDIAFPDCDDLDMAYYTTASPYSIRGVFLRSFYVSSSRGCPSSCTFCVSKKLRDYHGSRHFTRLRSPRSLVNEVLELKKRYAIDAFYFVDDLFTLKKDHVFEFCRLLKDSGAGLLWGCSSKVNTVDVDMLKAMKDSGCLQIDFGVEKGSDAALREVKKGITVAQIKSTFEACRKLGIRTFANMLVNTPGETEQDLADIEALLNDIRPTVVSINIFTPYPGCEIFENLCDWMKRPDYHLLMRDPRELAAKMPEKFRFARHAVDIDQWVIRVMKEQNSTWVAVKAHLNGRYLRTLARSSARMDYVRQAASLFKEFLVQKRMASYADNKDSRQK